MSPFPDLPVAPAWVDAAECRHHDPDVWFPHPTDLAAVAKAKAICRTCPVATECLAAAIARGEDHGVFGGQTTAERHGRPAPAPGCGTYSGYRRHNRLGQVSCVACLEALRVKRREERAVAS